MVAPWVELSSAGGCGGPREPVCVSLPCVHAREVTQPPSPSAEQGLHSQAFEDRRRAVTKPSFCARGLTTYFLPDAQASPFCSTLPAVAHCDLSERRAYAYAA